MVGRAHAEVQGSVLEAEIVSRVDGLEGPSVGVYRLGSREAGQDYGLALPRTRDQEAGQVEASSGPEPLLRGEPGADLTSLTSGGKRETSGSLQRGDEASRGASGDMLKALSDGLASAVRQRMSRTGPRAADSSKGRSLDDGTPSIHKMLYIKGLDSQISAEAGQSPEEDAGAATAEARISERQGEEHSHESVPELPQDLRSNHTAERLSGAPHHDGLESLAGEDRIPDAEALRRSLGVPDDLGNDG